MIEINNNAVKISKEEENKNKINKSSTKDYNIKNDSKIIEENLCKNNSFDEEESLRYDKAYKPSLIEKGEFSQRKSSTISTTISTSENNFEINNNLNINTNINNTQQFNNSNISNQTYLGRERINSNPICTYFESTSNYFKSTNNKGKNDYRKSSNYLEKNIYFREHFNSFDYMKFNNNENKDIFKNKNENKKSFDIKNITKNNNNKQSQNLHFMNNYLFEIPMNNYHYYNTDCKSFNIT